MTSPGQPVVELAGVEVDVGLDRPVLEDVDLTVRAGEFVAIAGPNGGGKTTLLRTILGLQRPSRGTVRVFGEPIEHLHGRHRLGYLRQRAVVGVRAPVTVREVVESGCLAHSGARLGRLRPADRERVASAIDVVGLTGLERRRVQQLSGGQQQRVFVARLLAADPELLALDEPTTGVDTRSQEAFAELLCELVRERGVTILYVSHEFGAVESHVDRLVLVRGGIDFDGPPGELDWREHDPAHDHGGEHRHVHRGHDHA